MSWLLGELRTFTVLALRSKGGTENRLPLPLQTTARAMILPFLRLQSRFLNKRGPYGYFVFDGFTDPTYPIRTVNISRAMKWYLCRTAIPCFIARNPNRAATAQTRGPGTHQRISVRKGLRRTTIR